MVNFLIKKRPTQALIKKIDKQIGKKSAKIEWIWLDNNANIILLESAPIALKQGVKKSDSLSDYSIFPDLYWLFDEKINKDLGILETKGLTKKLQEKLAEDEKFLQAFKTSILDFKLRRKMRLSASQVLLIEKFNMHKVFYDTGISAVKKPLTIKCIHAHYAHFLASNGANIIGKYLVEQHKLPSFSLI